MEHFICCICEGGFKLISVGPGKTVIGSRERRRTGKREREIERGGLLGSSGTEKARKLLSRWRFGSSLKLVKKKCLCDAWQTC